MEADNPKLVGHKVIGTGKQSGVDITGWIGKIIEHHSCTTYGIEFEKSHPHFHNCDGSAKMLHGFWCNHKVIELFPIISQWECD
jgi:hypothetical protein